MKVNYIGYGNTNGWDAAGVSDIWRYSTRDLIVLHTGKKHGNRYGSYRFKPTCPSFDKQLDN